MIFRWVILNNSIPFYSSSLKVKVQADAVKYYIYNCTYNVRGKVRRFKHLFISLFVPVTVLEPVRYCVCSVRSEQECH